MLEQTRDTRYKKVIKILWIILFLNLLVAAAKYFYGVATASLSMRNDGIASAFDALSNVVGVVGVSMAAQPPDKSHPYGHAKYETYASLAIGVMLVFAAIGLFRDGITSLLTNTHHVVVNAGSYGVMVGTLIINLVVSQVEGKQGKSLASEVLTADALHTRSDALVSISVIIGLIVSEMGYPIADTVVSIIVSVAIAVSAFEVFKAASETLSDHARLDVEELRTLAEQIDGVHSVHNIRTRGTEGEVFVDLHILVNPFMTVIDAHAIAREVEQVLKQHVSQITDVIVHIEPDTVEERSEGIQEDEKLGAAY